MKTMQVHLEDQNSYTIALGMYSYFDNFKEQKREKKHNNIITYQDKYIN